jgi:hypothetical protein
MTPAVQRAMTRFYDRLEEIQMDDNGVPSTRPAPLALGHRGLEISTLEELYRFAKAVCRTAFVPKDFHNDPEGTMVALEYAIELGLPMLQGLQNIYVVGGRPSIFGDLGLAMVEASGLMEDFFEDFEGEPYKDDFKAICISKRKGRSRPTIWQFSVQDAKMAKLWGKSGPWSENPKRQLQMRARWFVLRNAYADVLRGLYGREEMEDSITMAQTPQGYQQAPETALPATVAAQLEAPPTHPSAQHIKDLLTLMTHAGVPKELHYIELRKAVPRLEEGKTTQKYLQETLTIDEFEDLRTAYQERLQLLIESDVPLNDAQEGTQEAPESRLDSPDSSDQTASQGERDAKSPHREGMASTEAVMRVAHFADAHNLGSLFSQAMRRWPDGITPEALAHIEANLKDRVEAQAQTA